MTNIKLTPPADAGARLIAWLLITTGIIISTFLLVIPLLSIFIQEFSEGFVVLINNMGEADMLHAITLTLLFTSITVPINFLFGTLLAWLVSRFQFVGRQLLLTLLDIPFAISPVVAGLMYFLFWGVNGSAGRVLDNYGVQLMFTWPGMVLVTIFVTCPLCRSGVDPYHAESR